MQGNGGDHLTRGSGERNRLSPMEKWFRVLSAFLDKDEWGTRELARTTGLPRSAVHRIVHEMRRLAILTPARTRGEWRVGAALIRMALKLSQGIDVVTVARPVIEKTSEDSGETVILTLYSPERRQLIAVHAVESRHAVRYISDSLSDWSDLVVGSSGKGILAFLPPDERERILNDVPDPVPETKQSKDELRRQLAEIAARGYAFSRGERFDGAAGASAPVFDAAGSIKGDLIITWPLTRDAPGLEHKMGRLVRSAAREISAALGYVE